MSRLLLGLGGLLAATLPAQSFSLPASLAPDRNELPHASPWPLMVRDGRVQQYFAASEVGASLLTARQLELLRAEGYSEVQGFLFSPARPSTDVPGMLAAFGWRGTKVA